jgi:hypothetical protein
MTDGQDSYRLALWRYGFIGNNAEAQPRRAIQALIRFRAADAWAIERFFILTDIRAELAAEMEETET